MKFEIKRIALGFLLAAFCFSARASVYLQPVVYYNIDEFGNPVTNLITIQAWPPTNAIAGYGSNLVSSVSYTFQPVPTNGYGYWSNNIAPGNYRLQVSNYVFGVIFGVYSNSAPIILSQVGGLPVTTFQNFTIAQFSDAGTMARENTNNWLRPIEANLITALGWQPATNGGPVAVAQLPYIPATNSYGGISNAVGFTLATNGGPVAVTQLPYLPQTNASLTLPAGGLMTNYGVMWLYYNTNAPMGNTLTNLPNGTICSTSAGQLEVLSNMVWLLK